MLLGISIQEETPGGIAWGDLCTALQLCPCAQETFLSRREHPRGWQLSASREQGGWLCGRTGMRSGHGRLPQVPKDGRLVGLQHLACMHSHAGKKAIAGNIFLKVVFQNFKVSY